MKNAILNIAIASSRNSVDLFMFFELFPQRAAGMDAIRQKRKKKKDKGK